MGTGGRGRGCRMSRAGGEGDLGKTTVRSRVFATCQARVPGSVRVRGRPGTPVDRPRRGVQASARGAGSDGRARLGEPGRAQADLAHDTGLPVKPVSPTGFALAHNVRAQTEVDAVMAAAGQAGAQVVKQAQPTFYGGYAGYFQDPDGHLWEVAWNPAILPD